jgi:hypothetical protein
VELKTWQCSLNFTRGGAIINEEGGGLLEGSNCEALEGIKKRNLLNLYVTSGDDVQNVSEGISLTK